MTRRTTRFTTLHQPYQETPPFVTPQVAIGNNEETAQGQESNEYAKQKGTPWSQLQGDGGQ